MRDLVADRFGDQRLSAPGEPAGKVVLAVLQGEVADQDLAPRGGRGEPGGQVGPRCGTSPVELAFQAGVAPLEPVASGDHEQRGGHQPHDALQQPLQVTVGAVAGVLEGVQQDDRHHGLDTRQLRQVPGQQVRHERQRVQVRLSLPAHQQPGRHDLPLAVGPEANSTRPTAGLTS
jgi:hypothetical protein